MLSRNAQGLYWMGRYIERAGHLSRLLHLQIETLVDRPLREIHFGWRRIYASLNRKPPAAGDDFALSDDDLTLADAFTLADDLTFESSNPDSIRSYFACSRENARQARNCISAGMWTCLNLSWLHLKEVQIQDIWKPSPENFYAETTQHVDTFTGIARTSMYRDERWRFMQIGRFIERALLTSALLIAQIKTTKLQHETFDADWVSLLHLYQALDAYKWNYSIRIDSDQVLKLLTSDPQLPYSLGHSLNSISNEVASLPPGPHTDTDTGVRQLVGQLCAKIYLEGIEKVQWVHENLCQLHQLIVTTFIDYDIEDHPEQS